jgi:hypothetical protein
MNHRLDELFVRAGGQFGHYGEPILPDIEKFAELIVKECARAIITDSRLNDVRSAANGCVRTIKEHFGVE